MSPLVARCKPNHFGHTDLYGQKGYVFFENQRVLSSSLIIMSRVFARIHCA